MTGRRAMLVAACFAGMLHAAEPANYAPLSSYDTRNVEGWTVHLNKALLEGQTTLADQTLKVLQAQLLQISRVVPQEALRKLREVPLWVEARSQVKCMCYHPSRKWLEQNGFNPAKAKSVELGNPTNFLRWTTHQPWMVLHELAHAYHDRVLGWDHGEVRAAFKRAAESKSYESVLKHNGRKGRAYALNNHKEYFAEQSEAYFGTNDFYPFVRAELAQHDPEMHKLLAKLWGATKPKK